MLLLTSLLRALFILSLVLVPGLAVACLQNAYTPDSNIGSIIGTTAIYGYNHLNQRGTKTLNGHTRLLVYDQAGNLISELDGTTGAVLAEYIWLDGTPLAYIEQDQLYHVHADHLGTPKALTNTTGTVVWKADYSPFGQADITSQGLTFNPY